MPSVLNGEHIRRAFDRAAGSYVAVAELQREVEDRLLDRLDLTPKLTVRTALDLGAGPGRASLALSQRYPQARVLSLDISLAMLKQVGQEPCYRLCADAHALPLAEQSCDLVWSNLALQWCQPDLVFDQIRRVLKPGGLFLFTTFGPATLSELRAAWATVDQQPHVHEFIDMHILGDCAIAAGFVDPVMDMEMIELRYREVDQVMRELKQLGAVNAASDRRRGMTGKDRWRRVVQAYEARRRAGRIPASYEIVYGHAWGPPPGQPRRSADGEQIATFPVDQLRGTRRGP